ARYRGSVLGIGWSMLHPLLMTGIICTAFGTLFNADLYHYVPFLMAGLTCWQYLLTVSLAGSHCFFQGEAYIRQYPAPMAISPLRTMLGNSFHFGMALILVVILGAALRGVPPPGPLLSLVPSFLLLQLLGWSLAAFLGLLTVRFRDTHHLCDL